MELYCSDLGCCVNVRARPECAFPSPEHSCTRIYTPTQVATLQMRGSSFSLPSAQGTQDENATSINEWSPGMKSGMKYALVKGNSKGRRR